MLATQLAALVPIDAKILLCRLKMGTTILLQVRRL